MTSGLSSVRHVASWLSATRRTSVLLPDCLAPLTSTTRVSDSASSSDRRTCRSTRRPSGELSPQSLRHHLWWRGFLSRQKLAELSVCRCCSCQFAARSAVQPCCRWSERREAHGYVVAAWPRRHPCWCPKNAGQCLAARTSPESSLGYRSDRPRNGWRRGRPTQPEVTSWSMSWAIRIRPINCGAGCTG